jgi:hypothetical protein
MPRLELDDEDIIDTVPDLLSYEITNVVKHNIKIIKVGEGSLLFEQMVKHWEPRPGSSVFRFQKTQLVRDDQFINKIHKYTVLKKEEMQFISDPSHFERKTICLYPMTDALYVIDMIY